MPDHPLYLFKTARRPIYKKETRRMDEPWEVIVDPDADERLLVVVTAYAGDR